jgi:Flp pilus assembly protein TadG
MTQVSSSGILVRLNQFGRRSLVRFRADRRGVSAVEFAFILPLLIILFIGGNEVSQAVSMYRKASHAGSVIGDLVTQSASVANGTEMDNMFNAAKSIMAPYPDNTLKMVVALVTMDNNGAPRVTWRDSRNGGDEAAWVCNSPPPSRVTIPTAMRVANTSLVITEVEYEFKTNFYTITKDIFGTETIKLKDTAMLRPRVSETITYGDAGRACS